jgi:hypothetical protein
MYISYYGCAEYPAGVYSAGGERAGLLAASARVPHSHCLQPAAQPLLAALFAVSFVAVGALVLLSMFVGAITVR